jgi:S1-C subfamily serine protease
LQEGDVILSINRQPIATPEDVLRIQQSLKAGQPVAFRIQRSFAFGGHKQSTKIYVAGKLPTD